MPFESFSRDEELVGLFRFRLLRLLTAEALIDWLASAEAGFDWCASNRCGPHPFSSKAARSRHRSGRENRAARFRDPSPERRWRRSRRLNPSLPEHAIPVRHAADAPGPCRRSSPPERKIFWLNSCKRPSTDSAAFLPSIARFRQGFQHRQQRLRFVQREDLHFKFVHLNLRLNLQHPIQCNARPVLHICRVPGCG